MSEREGRLGLEIEGPGGRGGYLRSHREWKKKE